MHPLPRRSFLAGGLAAGSLVLVACGGSDDGDGGGVGSTAESELSFLRATFPDGFRQEALLVAGPAQRFAFVVADQIDNLRETAPATLDLAIVAADGSTVLETTIDRRADGIITPYYPAVTSFPTAGLYSASLPAYPNVAAVEFLVTDAAAVPVPQIGDPLPAVPTPTFDDAQGVADICTRAVDCPFHEIDLVDAAVNDKPTVLLVATPGFCQTDICGPVVDLLIEEAGERDDLNVIHAEVYVDPSDFETGAFPDLTAVVGALGMSYEPALFVADADHTVVARLDTTFDRSELADALALV
ncbi:MAG: hypothetical protein AAGA90_00670 [Actinomycetota bacterium]